MQAIEIVKKHPVAVGIGAIVIFGGVILLMSGGGGGSTTVMQTGPNDAEVAATYQLQAAQIQAGAQAQATAAQKEVALAEIAASLTAKSYDRDIAYNANEIAGTVALGAQQTQYQISQLQAQTTIAGIEADKNKFLAQQSSLVQQTQAIATMQTNVASYNYQTQVEQLKTQRMINETNASYAYATAIENKPQQGLFSWLFG